MCISKLLAYWIRSGKQVERGLSAKPTSFGGVLWRSGSRAPEVGWKHTQCGNLRTHVLSKSALTVCQTNSPFERYVHAKIVRFPVFPPSPGPAHFGIAYTGPIGERGIEPCEQFPKWQRVLNPTWKDTLTPISHQKVTKKAKNT